jgi:uncharacterized pyridoxamine 5'-phosphate oxidase family protein
LVISPAAEDALDAIWLALQDAVGRRTAFTAMQLATIGEAAAPRIRTIIVRRFDRPAGALFFISDRRAAKVRDILENADVALAGYDPASNTQLRMEGRASIVDDAAVGREVWALLRPPTRRMFDAPVAPGTPIPETPAEPGREGEHPAPAAAASDEPHPLCCLIRVDLDRVELLDLSLDPHMRASYARIATEWQGGRISP